LYQSINRLADEVELVVLVDVLEAKLKSILY
jgi:hypothetical protein